MKLFTNTICLLFIIQLSAQTNIKGLIKDAETNEGIIWADVLLYKNNTLLKGVVTSEKGTFIFEDIPEGSYTIKASYLGYTSYETTFLIANDQNKEFNILLNPSVYTLDEVLVQAEITTITYKGDRKIVNVGKDLMNAGAVASQILGQLPSVQIDGENNISMRGDENVKILVDGKPSSLQNDQLLQQLPSQAISKIELISNPSAKYQADGLSGIINIITKKSYKKGGQVNISGGGGTGSEPRANASVNGSFSTDKIKVFAEYSYYTGFRESQNTENEEREALSFVSNANQLSIFESPYYLKSGLDISIDSTNTLSASVRLNKFKSTSTPQSQIEQRFSSSGITENTFFNGNTNSEGTSTTYNLNHRKEFKGQSNYLETDINYSISPYSNTAERITNGSSFTETQNDVFESENDVLTLNTDYYDRTEKRTLEFGLRSDIRNLGDFQQRAISNNSGNSQINTVYDYKDRIYAAYGVFNKTFGKIDAKLGLRVEHTDLDLTANDSQVKSTYTNLFPSASFSYDKNEHYFSLNYSRRISRPQFFFISNIVLQIDQFTQFTGNPNLQPEYANKLELNYSKKLWGINLNSSLFYTYKENTIRSIQNIEGNNRINTFDNVGNSNLVGLEVYARFKPATWWTASLNAALYRSKFNQTNFLNDTTFRQDYGLNNTFKPFEGFNIQANFNVVPKSTTLQGELSGITFASIGLSKDIFKRAGNISLRVNDIFNSKRTNEIGTINSFDYRRSSLVTSSRHLYLSFRYNFSFGNKKYANKNRMRKRKQYTERRG